MLWFTPNSAASTTFVVRLRYHVWYLNHQAPAHRSPVGTTEPQESGFFTGGSGPPSTVAKAAIRPATFVAK